MSVMSELDAIYNDCAFGELCIMLQLAFEDGDIDTCKGLLIVLKDRVENSEMHKNS